MNFKKYGNLEFLDPKEFYSGPWEPIDSDFSEDDGEVYDIVYSHGETRYTII